MQPKFTRGPWVSGQADDFTMPRHGPVLIARDAHGFVVAVCGRPDITMAQANVRLISAAPDLYAALKRIAVHLADACDSGILDLTPEAKLWDIARAALSKAEGRDA